jgi:hypothetical protein
MNWNKALSERRESQKSIYKTYKTPGAALARKLNAFFQKGQDRLDRSWRAGCLEYVRRLRPDLFEAITAIEVELSDLWQATLNERASVDQFQRALDQWVSLHLDCLSAFASSSDVKVT